PGTFNVSAVGLPFSLPRTFALVRVEPYDRRAVASVAGGHSSRTRNKLRALELLPWGGGEPAAVTRELFIKPRRLRSPMRLLDESGVIDSRWALPAGIHHYQYSIFNPN